MVSAGTHLILHVLLCISVHQTLLALGGCCPWTSSFQSVSARVCCFLFQSNHYHV
jgi:hypothetical protein